jgi:hypothetical protein
MSDGIRQKRGARHRAAGAAPATDTASANGPWKASSTGLPTHSIGKVVVDPSNSSTLYSTGERGIFKSTDAGKTWTRLDSNLGKEYHPDSLLEKSHGPLTT